MPKSNPIARTKLRNKEQIVVALKSAARKLGHPPTTIELHLLAGIHRSQVAYRPWLSRGSTRPGTGTEKQYGVRIQAAALLHDGGNVLARDA